MNHCGFRVFNRTLFEAFHAQSAEGLEQFPGPQQKRRVGRPAIAFVPQHVEIRNSALAAEVKDLKQGSDAIEERARYELGMVKHDEIFFQVPGK